MEHGRKKKLIALTINFCFCRSPYSPGSAGPPDHGQHGGRRVSHQVEGNFNQQQQQFSQPMDQFDQYFFQSTHIGQPLQDDSSSGLPPEVNIEVPSDSDSSRRHSDPKSIILFGSSTIKVKKILPTLFA